MEGVETPMWLDDEHEDEWSRLANATFPGWYGPYDNGEWLYVKPTRFQTTWNMSYDDWFKVAVWAFKPNTGTEEEDAEVFQ